MSAKCILVLMQILFIYYVNCTRSFTVVLDTTESMLEEVDVIKNNIDHVLEAAKDVGEFVLVPFNDPDIGPNVISTSPQEIMHSLKSLTATGGRDCPEKSMAAIKTALEISAPDSFIFIFTDAYPKISVEVENIKSLCQNTKSQVIIFLSGKCINEEMGELSNPEYYYDVAYSCSGAVLDLDYFNLKQVFKYMQELVRTKWNDITSIKHSNNAGQKFNFYVDSFTSEVMVVVSGACPAVQIIDATGKPSRLEKILDTKQALVTRILNLEVGDYKLRTSCSGLSVTIYKKKDFPFEFGFSTLPPMSLEETCDRPLPGVTNYVAVYVPKSYNIRLEVLEVDLLHGEEKRIIRLEKLQGANIYLGKMLFEPHKPFRFYVIGRDIYSYRETKISTNMIEPQNEAIETDWLTPSVQIIKPESNIVDYQTDITLACKIKAYPKPDVKWLNGKNIQYISKESLNEIPSTYISHVFVANVTVNTTVYCNARNSQGEDTNSIELYVNRSNMFVVVQTPENKTIEYGDDDELKCQVNAYPEAKIIWYHNHTQIEPSETFMITPDGNVLQIKNMTLDTVGVYKCEASNGFETKTFTAIVDVSGLEMPKLEINMDEVKVKIHDSVTLNCSILDGSPVPEIKWKYAINEDDYNFQDLPKGVKVNKGVLMISDVQIMHKGIYTCEASNILGSDIQDVPITILAPPRIKPDDTEITVKEGDPVELKCEVEADPPATVKWEMSQDDLSVAFDSRHITDEFNNHRFTALWNDSGNYHCHAENEVGRAQKTITVNVLVAPFIEAPKVKTIEVKLGARVELACNVSYGNPAPTTWWEFQPTKVDAKSILVRGQGSVPLILKNITQYSEGTYTCIADNSVTAFDKIKIYLKIKK